MSNAGLVMEILFARSKLRKTLTQEREMARAYGQRTAQKLKLRLAILDAAACLADVPIKPPDRCHQLRQDRDEQFAVDLVKGERLIFEVADDPIPRLDDGGIDRTRVTKIRVLEVGDYHQ